MKDHYTLATVSKKDMINAFEISEDEAKLIHKYRKALPVITDADGEEGFCVDMRELHKQMKVSTPFSKWINRRLKSLQCKESGRTKLSSNKINDLGDYVVIHEEVKYQGSQGKIDYLLTVDAAKQVAMMENTETGRLVRKYFVLCEKLVYRMAKRNPVRNNCKLSTKMMASNIAGRVPKEKLPAMMMDMNAFICTVATGARPSAWKKNLGVSNVRDFLKDNEATRELRRYDEVAQFAEMLSRSPMQTKSSIKELTIQTFGESEIYFNYLNKSGVKKFDD